jgi:hypothetical protein
VRRLGVDARNPEVIDELKRKDDMPKETARDSDLLTTFALRRPLAWPVNFVRAAKRTAVLIRLSFGMEPVLLDRESWCDGYVIRGGVRG